MGNSTRDIFISSGSKSVPVAKSGMKADRIAFSKGAFETALKKVASAKPSKSTKP